MATVFVLLVSIGLLPSAAALPAEQSFGSEASTYALLPSGGDDTEAIQAAFDACGSTPGCTIQLDRGTYHTAQIVVHDFHGTFRGKGIGATTVEAIPDLPVTEAFPFWMVPASAANPWPMLFTFYDGTYTVSDMAFSVPSPTPTRGWMMSEGGPEVRGLNYVISMTGLAAEVTVTRIAVRGGPGDILGFNLNNAIGPQGVVHQEGSSDPNAMIPMRATFVVTSSYFSLAATHVALWNLVDSRATVRNNVFETSPYPVFYFDLSNTRVEVSHNDMRNVLGGGAGVFAVQTIPPFSSLMGCPERTESIVVHNDIEITDGAFGILFGDLGDIFGCERTLDMVASYNVIRGDSTAGMGIFSQWSRSAEVAGNDISVPPQAVYMWSTPGTVARNRIHGTLAAVVLDASTGVVVEQNEIWDDVFGIYLWSSNENVVARNVLVGCRIWGISLEAGSSDNVITQNEVYASGQFDLYWDETGAGNLWMKNVYSTSSPPDLST